MDREDISARFRAVDSANVADVLDGLGVSNQGVSPEIQGVSGTRLSGWAYTIAGQMMPYSGSGDPDKMRACNGIGSGEVSVWSGNGEGVCYFGELIAIGMAERGSAGALIDGGLRDTRALAEHGFDAFARYRSSVQSIGRWKATSWQEPVSISGATSRWVTVRPGDFVVADEDGAVVVPSEYVEEVLEKTEAITQTEMRIRDALKSGTSLATALEQFGHV